MEISKMITWQILLKIKKKQVSKIEEKNQILNMVH